MERELMFAHVPIQTIPRKDSSDLLHGQSQSVDLSSPSFYHKIFTTKGPNSLKAGAQGK